MSSFTLKGKLTEKFNEQQVSDKFKKREFVVEEKTQSGDGKTYVESIKFQLIQDKCDLLNQIPLGSEVEVSFNLRGKRYEKDGKVSYFTNLDAWQIAATRNITTAQHQSSQPMEQASNTSAPDDDLQF